MKLAFCLSALLVTTLPFLVNAQGKKVATPPPTDPPLLSASISELPEGTDRLDLYLLIGQSNMKGRGNMPEVAKSDPKVVMMHLKNDAWYLARHPLHLTGDPETFAGHDNAGVGPGLAFAEAIQANDPGARIGLVPCAVGGSAIALWGKEGRLYLEAIRRTKRALSQGPAGKTRLRGAIWLQGEADAKPGKLEIHAGALNALVDNLRTDLGVADLPFIACTIGELRDGAADGDIGKMNAILLDLPNQRSGTGCVDARDLKGHIGDKVHYDTASQEEIGRRFAGELLKTRGAPTPSPPAEGTPGVWPIERLKSEIPEFRIEDEPVPIQSVLYAGEPVDGKPTEVFAFYASPKTLGTSKGDETFPGIVLIHGGGGTAFSDWVWLWAQRGYAAIAMDLSGSRPPAPKFDEKGGKISDNGHPREERTKLEKGGLDHGHAQKFDCIGGTISDDWPYHAVANVMKAHTLLLSFPGVDPERTAVTGISWGGYTTCLVASLDDRFKAAVPVYGCGFLHEGESVQKPAIDALGDRRDAWIAAYDPSSHLAKCTVPTLWVNGTNDVHYVLDSYAKSYSLVKGPKMFRIQPMMSHGHPPGWAPAEIGIFVDSLINNGVPLPSIGEMKMDGDTVTIPFDSKTGMAKAELFYTESTGLRSKRKWNSIPARIEAGKTIAEGLPADANTWLMTFTDDRGAMVTSAVGMR
jgi:dienelactone hydrolase